MRRTSGRGDEDRRMYLGNSFCFRASGALDAQRPQDARFRVLRCHGAARVTGGLPGGGPSAPSATLLRSATFRALPARCSESPSAGTWPGGSGCRIPSRLRGESRSFFTNCRESGRKATESARSRQPRKGRIPACCRASGSVISRRLFRTVPAPCSAE